MVAQKCNNITIFFNPERGIVISFSCAATPGAAAAGHAVPGVRGTAAGGAAGGAEGTAASRGTAAAAGTPGSSGSLC